MQDSPDYFRTEMNKEFSTVFGGKKTTFCVPEENFAYHLRCKDVPSLENPEERLRELLENPLGARKLVDLVKPGDKVAILSDEFMMMPYTWVLAPVVVELLKKEAGIGDNDIILVNCPGTHQNEEEQSRNPLVMKTFGQLGGKHRMVLHDCDKKETHQFVGFTSQGTPVWVNKEVMEADVKIGFGCITPHHSAGNCGGGKIINPGCVARETLGSMHRRVMNQKHEVYHREWLLGAHGNDRFNEVRRDIEDAASVAGLDFKIDVVNNRPRKELANIFAGNFVDEYRAGADYANSIYGAPMNKTDITIYLAGERGTYLTSILLMPPTFADQATKKDGVCILVASAEKGYKRPRDSAKGAKGRHVDYDPKWIKHDSGWLARRLCGELNVGVNLRDVSLMWQTKATLENKHFYIVTQYPNKQLLREIGFTHVARTVDEALSKAFKEKGKDATVTVMEDGAVALPV